MTAPGHALHLPQRFFLLRMGRPHMPIRDLGAEPLAAWCPAAQRRHVGLGPCLIDEDQAGGINPVLIATPLGAAPGNVGTVLFPGEHGFF